MSQAGKIATGLGLVWLFKNKSQGFAWLFTFSPANVQGQNATTAFAMTADAAATRLTVTW